MLYESSTTTASSIPSNSGSSMFVSASISSTGISGRQSENGQLTQEEQRQIQQLQRRDKEVRAHERAHMMVGRELVIRGADYTFEKGPDDKQYAVAGEVTIDTSPVNGDPEATRDKAVHIRETALAPAKPSNQDRAVAAKASRMAMQARIDILRQQREESGASSGSSGVHMQQAYSQVQSQPASGSGYFHQTA